MTATKVQISITLGSATFDFCGPNDTTTHQTYGVLQAEGGTAEAALASLTARARTQAATIADAAARKDRSITTHDSHPEATLSRRFALRTVRLAAGLLTDGSLGWISYGTLVAQDSGNDLKCPNCPYNQRR
ncbi:hypothetical protein [Spirillospora sp. CA-294931]|uniref:hypothetical protein n=1 Tax=Spirillospora sp. CA-294931 TaxID=3240042 RepID=UPI003D8FD90D